MGSSAGNNVTIDILFDPNNQLGKGLANARVELEQFAQTTDTASRNAGSSLNANFVEKFLIRQALRASLRDVEEFFSSSIKASEEFAKSQERLNGAILQTGQSYAVAQRAAQQYQSLTASTRTEANAATASTAEIAKRAGLTSESDAQIQRTVADIVAGHGGGAEETTKALAKLAQGSGEIIKELTGKTAAEIDRSYAVLPDKLPKDLTDMEKSAAQLNAVINEGKLFNGEAANHLETIAGKTEQAANKWEDFKAGVGDAILSSAQLKDVLDGLLSVIGELPGAAHKGFGSVTQAGQAAEDSLNGGVVGTTKSIINHVELGAKASFATLGGIFSGDIFTERGRAGLALADQYRDEITNRDRTNAEEGQAAQNRATANRIAREARGAGLSNAQVADLFKRQGSEAGFDIEAELSKQVTALEKTNAAKEKKRQEDEQNELAHIQKEKENQKKAADVLKGLQDDSTKVFQTIATDLEANNPFVKPFAQGVDAIEKFRLKFGPLGDEVVNSLERIDKTARDKQIFELRFNSQESAFKLQQESRDLLEDEYRRRTALTGAEERSLDVLRSRVDIITKGADLRRQADFLENPYAGNEFTDVGKKNFAYDRFKQLVDLSKQYAGNAPGNRAAQEIVDQSLRGLTDNLSIQQFRRLQNSGDPKEREVAREIIAERRREAGRLDEQFKDSIENARFGERQRRDAEEQLRHIGQLRQSGSGLGDFALEKADKEALAVLKGLNPKELTSALRLGMVDILQREANREARKEQEAREAIKTAERQRNDIIRAIQGEKVAVDGGDKNVINRINKSLDPSSFKQFTDLSEIGNYGKRNALDPQDARFNPGSPYANANFSSGSQGLYGAASPFALSERAAAEAGGGGSDGAALQPFAGLPGGAPQFSTDELLNSFVRQQMKGGLIGDPAALLKDYKPTLDEQLNALTKKQAAGTFGGDLRGLFLPDINETLRGAGRSAEQQQQKEPTSELTGAVKDLTAELKKSSADSKMTEVLERLIKAIGEGSDVTVTIDDNRVSEQTRIAAGSTDPGDYPKSPTDYSDLQNNYGMSG